MLCYCYVPCWLRWERTGLQCRRPRFKPCVGKIPWRRKWQPTPVVLPGEFHGQRSLAGYSPWGHKEQDTTEQLTHFDSNKKSNASWIYKKKKMLSVVMGSVLCTNTSSSYVYCIVFNWNKELKYTLLPLTFTS